MSSICAKTYCVKTYCAKTSCVTKTCCVAAKANRVPEALPVLVACARNVLQVVGVALAAASLAACAQSSVVGNNSGFVSSSSRQASVERHPAGIPPHEPASGVREKAYPVGAARQGRPSR